MRYLLAVLALALSLTNSAIAATNAGIVVQDTGAPTGSPVQMESCLIQSPGQGAARIAGTAAVGYLASKIHNGWDALATATGGAVVAAGTAPYLVVNLTNESGWTADIIRIKVQAPDGSIAYIRDVASMEPGVTIRHTFRQGAGLSGQSFFDTNYPRADQCSVDWVHFTNGKVWADPDHYARKHD